MVMLTVPLPAPFAPAVTVFIPRRSQRSTQVEVDVTLTLVCSPAAMEVLLA